MKYFEERIRDLQSMISVLNEDCLHQYSSQITENNPTLDNFLLSNKQDLDKISDEISCIYDNYIQLERLIGNVISKKIELFYFLQKYFKKHGDWTSEKIAKVIIEFNNNGFKSDIVRQFVLFIRSMFFNDNDIIFQNIKCLGLFEFVYDTYHNIGLTFEDSITGNQFSLQIPYILSDKSNIKFNDNVYLCDYNTTEYRYPCYVLDIPNNFGSSHIISKNYDIRIMRDDIYNFVKNGCI
jgi:hypothetical protein